jgi:hypothetical protein
VPGATKEQKRRRIVPAQATVSVERLTARVVQLENSNLALCIVIAVVVSIGIIAMTAATLPHIWRPNGLQHSAAPCATAKVPAASCRAPRLRPAERIIDA